MTTELAVPAPDLARHSRAAPGGDGGVFAHHGVCTPGVRLFRALRFRSKAAMISLAFVGPLPAWSADSCSSRPRSR